MIPWWCLVLVLLGVGNFLAFRMDGQILVALLSMFVVPIPVGVSTGKVGRVLLAALAPVFTLILVGTLGRSLLEPLHLNGAPVEWGWLISSILILPVAIANALCPPPYRLSVLALQSMWVWYFAALFVSRGQVHMPEALAIAVAGPIVFMITALLGRLVPAQGQEHLKPT